MHFEGGKETTGGKNAWQSGLTGEKLGSTQGHDGQWPGGSPSEKRKCGEVQPHRYQLSELKEGFERGKQKRQTKDLLW